MYNFQLTVQSMCVCACGLIYYTNVYFGCNNTFNVPIKTYQYCGFACCNDATIPLVVITTISTLLLRERSATRWICWPYSITIDVTLIGQMRKCHNARGILVDYIIDSIQDSVNNM